MKTEDIFTVVITRFSVRMQHNTVLLDRGQDWLFDIDRLKHKLLLLETINIPSVQNSTALPDCHLILIDPLLPEEIRAELLELSQNNTIIKVHTFDHNKVKNYRNCMWLIELLDISASRILTMHLDDDDALQRDYLTEVLSICRSAKSKDLGFFWIGTSKHEEWDLKFTDDAPFGYRKPITKYLSQYLTGLGLSVCSVNHPDSPNVFSLGHEEVLECFSKCAKTKRLGLLKKTRYRFHFMRKAMKIRKPFFATKLMLGSSIAFDLSTESKLILAGLVINHGDNLQKSRFEANKEKREIVDATGFTEYSIDPQKVKQRLQRTESRANNPRFVGSPVNPATARKP